MRIRIKILFLSLSFLCVPAGALPVSVPLTKTETVVWDKLDLPGPGLAGVFAGIIDGHIVLAGGADFPDGLPSAGGKKVWHRDVYTYDSTEGWRCFPNSLDVPVAYGSSFQTEKGIVCVGGCNEGGSLDDVFLLTLCADGTPSITEMPSLPVPISNMAGARIGQKIYIAGGITGEGTSEFLNTFYALDLSNSVETWQSLPSIPCEPRAFSVAAAQSNGQDNCFYLFSGRSVSPIGEWTVFRDCWAFNPRLAEWKQVPGDYPVMAGTAASFGSNHILFAGGRQGDYISEDDNSLRLYHTVTGTLERVAIDSVALPVTTVMLRDGSLFWLISGETAPGVRSPNVLKGTIINSTPHLRFMDVVVIVLYFLILAWMGWFFSKRQKNADDYFKGGGRIPWIIAGLSIFGTSLSAITFMAIPAKSFATDWSYLFYNVGIVLVVPLITMLFIPFYRKLGITTAYEYLEKRFSPFVRVLCSFFFIIYQVGRMGVVLLLPSIALNVVTGFNIFLCIGLMGVLALVYTCMGGIEAVAWTDAMQVVVLVGAAIMVVVSISLQLGGGFGDIISIAQSDGKFSIGSTRFDLRQATLWTALIASVFTNITTYGTDQTIVQRYLTTSTEKEAKKGVYINALLSIPATLLFFFVGTALYAFFKTNPLELSPSINNPDAILPWYVSIHMPVGVKGLVIAGIFAAAMSTISASMNSAATAYVVDIRPKVFRRTGGLRVARIATIVIGGAGILFAVLMATWDVKSLWDEFSVLLGLLLGSLGGLFLLGFLCRRANATGAVCGILASSIVQIFVIRAQSVHLLLYSSVGFIICFIVGYLVSLLTGGSRKDLTNLVIDKV